MFNKNRKAFTLIELLVTIGVLSVIAAGVVALINPVERNRQANDAKVQSDVAQVATGLQAFVANSTDGLYPNAANYGALGTFLSTGGYLTTMPQPPSGYTQGYQYVGGGSATVAMCGQVRGSRWGTGVNWKWKWESTTGTTCAVNGATCTTAACPAL